jgi:protein ImuB
VQRFTLQFVHRDAPATRISVGVSMPDRNSERFLTLTRERLEHTVLPSATIALKLSADEFAAPTALHTDMLSGASEQSEEFAHTLDRIAARLGEQHVHGVKAVADHRPESSWATAAAEEARQRLEFPERPLWLLAQPQPLQLSVLPTVGVERIESGWWDGRDEQRDYFIAHTPQGAALWVYKDLHDGSWHLHGFWS